MTHSLDSFITDSANSATALYTGHKSSVNALGVYADSSDDPFDDPKVETIAEIFNRIWRGHIGIVSTAFIADATPAALTAHTRDRDQYGAVIDSFIHGIVNYTWTQWEGPDVLFGGGAENFCSPELGGETYMNRDYYNVFRDAGYKLVYNNTELQASANDERTLGIFSTSNMEKCPDCLGGDATDQPGLKEMTLKAIDILNTKSISSGDNGWFIMSEAASIDKQMHLLDYDRALGELLELDDTIKHSIAHLEELGVLDETLIVVTADHGHGFDVFGNVDTKYFNAQGTDRAKRNAIGTYQNSGESQYVNTGNLRYAESNFPSNWDPRYTLAQGVGAFPDHRENYQVHKGGPRLPAINITGFPEDDYFANPEDNVGGIIINGTLPTSAAQGVHSLTDVPVSRIFPYLARLTSDTCFAIRSSPWVLAARSLAASIAASTSFSRWPNAWDWGRSRKQPMMARTVAMMGIGIVPEVVSLDITITMATSRDTVVVVGGEMCEVLGWNTTHGESAWRLWDQMDITPWRGIRHVELRKAGLADKAV
nr:alkaline phosphatase h [Quercus suber]